MLKANSFMLRIISLFIISTILLTGCFPQPGNVYTYPNIGLGTSSLTPPQDENLNVDGSTSSRDNLTTYIIHKLASVLAMDNNGEILGLLYAEDFDKKSTFTFKVYPAIYLFNSANLLSVNNNLISAKRVIIAEKGYKIINADLNNNWIVWSETNMNNWKVYRLNWNTKEQNLLAEGQLLNHSNDDFPVISLYENRAVFNVNDRETTKLVLYDFTQNNMAKTIQEFNSQEKYIGPPKLYEDNIVWHLKNLSNGKSKVFLYNINNEKVKELSPEKSSAEYPDIWKNYVVWLSPISNKPEERLLVYNLDSQKIIFNTTLSKGDNSSFYRPSIANGKLAWNDINTSFPEECNIKYYNLVTKETKTVEVADNLYGIFVPNNLEIHDSWISYTHPQDRVPPPEYPSRVIGSLLLRFTFPLGKNKKKR